MKAAWYETQGRAADVMNIGEMPDPEPGPGEVRIRVRASGINPGDVKKRQDSFGVGMAYPRVIPHSDGAGVIDQVGEGVPAARVGERVWCFGAQSYRAFGTAAEYTVVPEALAIPLSQQVSFEQGACLGIPGITGYQAVYAAGTVEGKTVLVQGGAGAVGQCAVALARNGGARVIASVRSEADEAVAQRAGAHLVLRTDGQSDDQTVAEVQSFAPGGVDHIVEVAFHANIFLDEQLLAQDGSIAAYATGHPEPSIPFWPLLFKNTRLYFLGSDDFPMDIKRAAARRLNEVLEAEWAGFDIAGRFPLEEIATAHTLLETGKERGRIVLVIE